MEQITLKEAIEILDSQKGSLNAEIYLEGLLVDSINSDGPDGCPDEGWSATVGEDKEDNQRLPEIHPSPYLINRRRIAVSEHTLFEYEPLSLDEECHDDLRDEWPREDIWNERG